MVRQILRTGKSSICAYSDSKRECTVEARSRRDGAGADELLRIGFHVDMKVNSRKTPQSLCTALIAIETAAELAA